MILDNLPAMRFAKQHGVNIRWTGFPVGYMFPQSNDDYIIYHVKFRFLVHEYEGSGVEIIGTGEEGMSVISDSDKKKASGFEIVGFEVYPCSVKFNPEVMSKHNMYDNLTSVSCPTEIEKSQIIREPERGSFTHEVEFVKSNIKWTSRWDAYLKMEGARAHWFSILNSSIMPTVIMPTAHIQYPSHYILSSFHTHNTHFSHYFPSPTPPFIPHSFLFYPPMCMKVTCMTP